MLRALLTCLCLAFAASTSARAPDVVLILADDMAYADLSCYGGNTPTPNIDSLAREGVRLTRFYANAPECTPTRTALMTGRYPQRVGGMECALGTGNVGRYDDAIRLRQTHDLGLPVTENTLVRGLKAAGYRCVVSGKWHLGYEPKFSPVEHGFDASFGPNAGGVDYFHHSEWDGIPALFENGRAIKKDGYMTDLITDYAVAAIEKREAGHPLFLYVPYTAPHTPYQGPKDRKPEPLLEPVWNEGSVETYKAMMRSLDDGVGRILASLEKRGMKRETIVVFMSDNGGAKLGNSGPFSGTKGTLYEGGLRVPCLVRWPAGIDAGLTSDQTSVTMDFTHSVLRLAGALPAGRKLEGMDILAHLAEKRPAIPRTLFWRYRRGESTWRAAMEGELKLIHQQNGGDLKRELFDLKEDAGEKSNLLSTRPKDVERLEALLQSWQADVKAAR
ncbi:MAG TPA: sulfatase-like hydrolase/transferase [Prosthecobacter sp.]|nr:sulfatase-like hydrolase/transferase [Prosthecobacter sp.]